MSAPSPTPSRSATAPSYSRSRRARGCTPVTPTATRFSRRCRCGVAPLVPYPGLVDHEVQLPGLAAIGREGLLETTGSGREHRDIEAHQHAAAVVVLAVQKFSATPIEAADGRRTEDARRTARNVHAPLVGLRVVETQRQVLEVPRGAIELDLSQVRPAVPNLPHDVGAVVFHPAAGAREWMQQSLHVYPPRAYIPIEVVLPVALLRGLRGSDQQQCAQQNQDANTLHDCSFRFAGKTSP